MNGWQKLMKVQSSMSVSKDKDGGRFKYYDIGNILAEAKPHLLSAGAVITLTDKLEERNDKTYLTATATFIDADTGETVTQVDAIMEHIQRRNMDASQSTGATSTYARKRALAGLLLVDGEEDPDALSKKNQPQRQVQRPQKSQQRLASVPRTDFVAKLTQLCQKARVDVNDFVFTLVHADLNSLTNAEIADAIGNFNGCLSEYKKLKAAEAEEIPL